MTHSALHASNRHTHFQFMHFINMDKLIPSLLLWQTRIYILPSKYIIWLHYHKLRNISRSNGSYCVTIQNKKNSLSNIPKFRSLFLAGTFQCTFGKCQTKSIKQGNPWRNIFVANSFWLVHQEVMVFQLRCCVNLSCLTTDNCLYLLPQIQTTDYTFSSYFPDPCYVL